MKVKNSAASRGVFRKVSDKASQNARLMVTVNRMRRKRRGIRPQGIRKEIGTSTKLEWIWAVSPASMKHFEELVEDAPKSLLIVDSGITCLSTAPALGAMKHSFVARDADEPGWVTSGRNGGQAILGIKVDPDALERRFSADLDPRVVATSDRLADDVFEMFELSLVYRNKCEAVSHGRIQPVHCLAGHHRTPAYLGGCSRSKVLDAE